MKDSDISTKPGVTLDYLGTLTKLEYHNSKP